jgi:hypothetical protein
MKTNPAHHDGQRWNYRGFIIWCFDGYYDVHEEVDAHPLAEGLSTPEEARAVINDARWFKAFSGGSVKFSTRH